jgi:hypothetical protein
MCLLLVGGLLALCLALLVSAVAVCVCVVLARSLGVVGGSELPLRRQAKITPEQRGQERSGRLILPKKAHVRTEQRQTLRQGKQHKTGDKEKEGNTHAIHTHTDAAVANSATASAHDRAALPTRISYAALHSWLCCSNPTPHLNFHPSCSLASSPPRAPSCCARRHSLVCRWHRRYVRILPLLARSLADLNGTSEPRSQHELEC